jgi:CO/xanthine dehydrogenase FAD-binding subunit
LPGAFYNRGTHYYRKVGERRRLFQGLHGGVCVGRDGVPDVRIVLGSIAPIHCVLRTEETLRGQQLKTELVATARTALTQEITPIDDIRSTAAYRARVSGNLLTDFLRTLKA